MKHPDLNKLAKEVYQANKDKGFHDQVQSNETSLMLVITELSEAVEADRKGKRADLDGFILLNNASVERTKNPEYFNTVAFCSKIKDTVEDELADAVIRLLDLAGLRDVWLSEYTPSLKDETSEFQAIFYKRSFCENIFYITKDINRLVNIDGNIAHSIMMIEFLSQSLSIDLWQHVELKLKYNQTRPIKHGKRY